MLSRSLRALTVAASTAACLAAQVPPGHLLVTQLGDAAQPRPGLAILEPLQGRISPVGNVTTQSWLLRRAIASASGDQILLAVTLPGGAPAILAARLSGNQLGAATPFATGLFGDPTGLLRLPDGRLLASTTHTVYVAPAAGGMALPVIPTAVPLGCADLAWAGDRVFALAVDESGAAPVNSLYEVDLALAVRHHPIAIPTPARAVAWAPDLGGLLVGDNGGTLHLVDGRFVTTTWLRTGLLGITGLGRNDDQRDVLVGSFGAAHRLVGQRITASYPFPGNGALVDFDYVPYRSEFVTYGAGCAGTNGLAPELSALGRPHPGNASFALTLARARAATQAALFIGFAPLDFDLGFLGMLGCRLLVQPTLDRPVATGNGTVASPFPIPPSAALAGRSIWFQWLVIDLGANGFGVVASNGGRADI